MSHFLYTETCPKCRKNGHDIAGDNLAVYSDNHKWCYRCGYFEPGDIAHKINKPIVNSKGLLYPDIVPLSEECLEYLDKFNLTREEIYDNLNGHEDGYSYFDSKFFLVRRLHKKPKVIVKGEVVGNEPIFACQEGSNTIVLCEDIISAIKISRVKDACALLSNQINGTLLYRLSSRYDNCVLWLDPDMYEHMLKTLLPRVQPYFKQVGVILSGFDPKYYSTNEIKERVK